MQNTVKKLAVVLPAMLLTLSAQAADQFKVTITNLGAQPLSPLFASASDNQFNTFSVGSTSSLGIKKIAEGGDTTAMKAIAAAAGSHVSSYAVAAGGPIGTGGSGNLTLWADAAHPYFSFAAMLGKTNDGFIGESVDSLGLMLYSGGNAKSFTFDVFGTRAWDAGTEENTQNAADLGFLGGHGNPADHDNHIRVHDGIIAGVGDSWQLQPTWTRSTKIATITVQSVPEPISMSALAIGSLALLRRKRNKA